MAFTLDNFVRSTLQADITAGATTVTVTKAAPPLRDPPDATVDAPGLLILQDVPTSPTKIEVISYTGRSIVGTVVTLTGVTRGLEGSTASPWSAGAPTFSGITAGVLAELELALMPGDGLSMLDSAAATKLTGIAAGAEVNVQADWNAASGDAHILNKPTITAPVNADWSAGSGLAQILNKPTLGSAAAQNASAFATAAQGATADAALPASSGAAVNLTLRTPNDANANVALTVGPTDANKQIALIVANGILRWDFSGNIWYGSGSMAWSFGGVDKMTLDKSGNLAVAGAITIGGGRKISKVTLSSATPGSLADGELYLQY